MISSVCAIPLSSNEGYAADDTSFIKNGDAYGVFLDLNEDSINEFFSSLTGEKMNKEDVREWIETKSGNFGAISEYLKELGIDITLKQLYDIDYDIDIDIGFGFEQISFTNDTYTYRFNIVADGKINVSYSTLEKDCANYLGELTDDLTIEELYDQKIGTAETKDVYLPVDFKLNTNIGAEIIVTVDKDGTIFAADGNIAGSVALDAEKEVIEKYNDATYSDTRTIDSEESVLMIVETLSSGSKDVIDVCTFIESDTTDAIAETLSTILEMIPADGIPGAVKDLMEYLIDTCTNNDRGAFRMQLPTGKDLFERLDRAKVERVLKTFEDNMTGDVLKFTGFLKALDTLTDNKYGIYEFVNNNSFVLNYFGIKNLDAITDLLFGEGGLKLSKSEKNNLVRSSENAFNEMLGTMESKTFKVKFFEEDGETPIGNPIDVKWGQAVQKNSAISAAETKEGYTFIGWMIRGSPYICADLSKIYSDVELVPLFAKTYGDLDALLADILNQSDLFTEIQYNGADITVSVETISAAGAGQVHITVKGAADSPVKSIEWNLGKGAAGTSTTVNLAFTSSVVDGGIQIDFKHNGELPASTYVSIDVGDKFENGAVIDLYHIEDGKQVLVNGYFVVNNGKVNVPLEECSSYVLKVNGELTDIDPIVIVDPTDDNGGKGGMNIALIAGVGVGIAAVVGIGIFFFLRKR